jgi:hypothetical protein
MWPFKKRQKHQVYFTCEEWAIRKYAPIEPAKNFLPKAFKDMPTYIRKEQHGIDSVKTVRSCPGIIDYCSAGFVIPAWCDIELIPSPNGESVNIRYSHTKFNQGWHPKEQLQNLLANKFTVRTAIKLDNPWKMWAAEGYGLLYQPMYYYDDTRNWEALPAWVDGDLGNIVSPINIMLKENKYTLIKMGEPLIQIIPIKREPITAYTGDVNKTTLARHVGISYLALSTFAGWLKHMRAKKSYEVDAHDTELPTE